MARRKNLFVPLSGQTGLHFIENALCSLTYEETLVAGHSFQRAAESIVSLLISPVAFASLGQYMALEHTIDAYFSLSKDEVTGRRGFELPRENTEQKVEESVEQMLRSGLSDGLFRASLELMDIFGKDQEYEEIFLGLQYTALTQAWSAFEVLSGDLWRSLLNTYPKEFAQKAFSSVDSSSESAGSKRTVDIGFLAKHDFDVSSVLGNLLVAKYDFTGVSSIEKAYKAILGKHFNLSAILSQNRTLMHLEALRHLILHRGGIVDDRFASRIRDARFKFKPEEQVKLTGRQALSLVHNAFRSGSDLLMLVDDALCDVID